MAELDVERDFPGFDAAQVTVTALPRRHWVSPLSDQVAVVKLAAVTHPDRILEVGSFQGHTALLLAMNLPLETEITTVDVLPNHGEVYLGGPFAERIKRHIGTMDTLPSERLFDFIFLDADHREEEVRRDTDSALDRLAAGGVLVWHDYVDSLWTSRLNRVPEVLAEYASRLSIRSLPGTRLAVYRSPPSSGG